MTQQEVAEEMLISTTHYRNIENNNIKYVTAEMVIAICIAMKLDFEYSMDLLEKSGHSGIFQMKNEKSVAYRKILMLNGQCSLREVNDALIKIGIDPLIVERIK